MVEKPKTISYATPSRTLEFGWTKKYLILGSIFTCAYYGVVVILFKIADVHEGRGELIPTWLENAGTVTCYPLALLSGTPMGSLAQYIVLTFVNGPLWGFAASALTLTALPLCRCVFISALIVEARFAFRI